MGILSHLHATRFARAVYANRLRGRTRGGITLTVVIDSALGRAADVVAT